MIFEMTKSEIKKQNFTFDNLNKFIKRYRKYIHCDKEKLIEGIPLELVDIITKRQYYIKEDIIHKLTQYKDFEFLADKKRDDRTVLFMIYTICISQIYENIIIELIKNFNCSCQKTGSCFNYNFAKASNQADLTIITNNNKKYEIELQRSNFMLRNKTFELKYYKINKNVLNYVIDEDTAELKLLIINLNPKMNRVDSKYDIQYTNYLQQSHKKGFYINNVTLKDFKSYEYIVDKFENFEDMFKYIFI